MAENNAEKNIFDAIREHSDNRGKDTSVIDLAERAIRASGLKIPLLTDLEPEITRSESLSVKGVETYQAPIQPTKPDRKLADLSTPKDHQEYFTDSLRGFLGQPNIVVPLPSQKHVDLGKKIQDVGFTSYEPIVFPKLTIDENFAYPPNWQFRLDPWVYQQIEERKLKEDVLDSEEVWGWLDISEGLDWSDGSPMYDDKHPVDKPMAQLLVDLREQGQIKITDWTRKLDKRSLYGISADEARTVVYTALAKMWAVEPDQVTDLQVTDLTVTQFNIAWNWLYRHFGEKNSWVWLRNPFADGYRLIAGYSGSRGLSGVRFDWAGNHDVDVRVRPLVLSPSGA